MAIKIVTFRITGTSPLMQSNPASMSSSDEGTGLATKKVYNDEEEASIRAYRDSEGHFVHPSASFRRAMMTAVSGRKFGKKAARMVVAGAAFPAETDCLLLDENEKPIAGYEIDKRPVVVNKSRVLRCRPKFSPWRLLLPIEIDTELLTDEQALESLQLAGRIIGIGEFRPDPSNGRSGVGTFGRFTAEIV